MRPTLILAWFIEKICINQASKWQFLPYIEKGLVNYCRVDICNVGGFTEAMKVTIEVLPATDTQIH